MKSYRGLVLASGPVLAVVLLIVALLHRPDGPAAPRKIARPAPPKAAAAPPAPAPMARAAVPQRPEIVVAKNMDEARVMQTYQTFRSAVAMGNARVQAEIRKALLKDEELALRVAESALARAPTEADREIDRKALEALRR